MDKSDRLITVKVNIRRVHAEAIADMLADAATLTDGRDLLERLIRSGVEVRLPTAGETIAELRGVTNGQ